MDNKFRVHEFSQQDFIRLASKKHEEYFDFQSYFGKNQNSANYYCVSKNDQFFDFILIYYSSIYQLGYWLSPKLRGKGLSQDYFDITFNLLKRHDPKCLFAVIDNGNRPSQKLVSRFGFEVMVSCENKKIFVWYNPRKAQ